MLALKWSDIDFENNTISITKTYYNPNNNKKYQILPPKTESSIGKISVDPNVIKVLRDYKINVQNNWKNELYNDNHCNEKTINVDTNHYVTYQHTQKYLYALIQIHTLRIAHKSGVHIKEIQTITA